MDKTGRLIYLPRKQWKHIASDHPLLANEVYKMQEALILPLTIRPSVHNEQVREYYKYDKERREYLLVVVKYLNGTGFIITSTYTRKIKT